MHPPSIYAKPTCREKSNRLGISFTFLLKSPGGERLGRVVIEHPDRALEDDRPVVVDIVGEVDRAAAYLHAIGQGGFVDVVTIKPFAAERGNQRRMDIHDPAGKVIGNGQ